MAKKYVSMGSVKRDGNKFTSKHTVKSTDKKKIDYIHIQWKADGAGGDASGNYKNVKKDNGDHSFKITRSDFYPVGGKGAIKSVRVRAKGVESKRNKKTGKTKLKDKGAWSDWVKFEPKDPPRPTVEPEVDADKGEVSFKIGTGDHSKTTAAEFYDCSYSVNRTCNVGTPGKVGSGTSSDEDFTAGPYDVREATSLAYGEWVKIECTATSRGFGGSSSRTAAHVFARPYPPKVSEAALSGDRVTGVVTVRFSLDQAGGLAPVDTVQLQRLVTDVTTAAEAAAASGWTDVESGKDDGTVAALTDNSPTASPVEAGKHVWYRVEAKRDNLTSPSAPVECAQLYLPKSQTSTGNVAISVVSVGDKRVELSLVDSETDDDCIRVSWSEDEDAWSSTKQPTSFDVTWLESGKANVFVGGLENGKRYWFRARSVDADAEGKEVLGELSAPVHGTPSSDSGTVSVYAPENVPVGSGMDLAWEFSSDMQQERADVVVGGSIVCSVSGVGAKAHVPASAFDGMAGKSAEVVVRVTAGGGAFASEPAYVVVADAPSCAVSAPLLTAQPLAFSIVTDSPNGPAATVQVIAEGFSGTGLDGDMPQFNGDCVWSADVSPAWEAGGSGTYNATVTAPGGLAFWDGCRYTVSAVLHDPSTGLDSADASAMFDVAWAHQAGVPTGKVEVDEDELEATITVYPPTGKPEEGDDDPDGVGDAYQPGDTFDLYRVTPDGERRIASGLLFGSTVVDRFAPFGKGVNLRYIAVTRTVDGDWSPSADLEYTLPYGALRFDWGNGESLSLPYNIEESASYDKGYDEDTMLDGDVIGWWDGSTQRSESLDTDLIKLRSAEEEEAIASIARYPGPVFVRTPSGAAFPANVVPDKISRSYENRTVSVSLSCKETSLTEEHMPSADDITPMAWSGGGVNVIDGAVYDAATGILLQGWTYCGKERSGDTLYVCDQDGIVRNGDGAEMAGYTWDGENVLTAANVSVPLDTWTLIGEVGDTTYLLDTQGNVRYADGTLADGYTWDGETLEDASGNVVPLGEYYRVTFNPNGVAATGMPADQYKSPGVDMTISDAQPQYPRNRLFVWSKRGEGGHDYDPELDDYYNPGDTYSKDEDMELYALWVSVPEITSLDVQRCDGLGNLSTTGAYMLVTARCEADESLKGVSPGWLQGIMKASGSYLKNGETAAKSFTMTDRGGGVWNAVVAGLDMGSVYTVSVTASYAAQKTTASIEFGGE